MSRNDLGAYARNATSESLSSQMQHFKLKL